MHKLVHEGMFHMSFIEEISLTKDHSPSVGRKPARTREVTGYARDVSWCGVYTGEVEVFKHELYWWTYISRERNVEVQGKDRRAVVQ
jgi:hypothetical protein